MAAESRPRATLGMQPFLVLGAALLGGFAPTGVVYAGLPTAAPSPGAGAVLRVDHPGRIDRSFNKVKIGRTSGTSVGASVTLNEDNSLTLVGKAGAWRDSGTATQLLRVDASGKVLDTGFQLAPEVAEVIEVAERTGIGLFSSWAWHPQPDDSVIVSTPFELIRLTPTGALATGFTSPPLAKGDVILGFANAAEGRFWIVVQGANSKTLMRVNADGSIDASFTPLRLPGLAHSVPGSGHNDTLTYDERVLRRIAADGSVDPSFSYKRRDLGIIARLPRGRTLIEWNKDPRRVSHLAILKRSGSVDRSFRFRNPQKLWVNTVMAQGRDLVVQGSEAGVRPRLFRIKPSGSIDRTFRAPRMWVDDWAVQPDGRIVVAGRDPQNPKTKPGFVIRLR